MRVFARDAKDGTTLEIARQFTVAVRVVGPTGARVPSVPVELVINRSAGTGVTDAAGLHRFAYSESWAGRYEGKPLVADARLGVRVPGLTQCAASFPMGAPPAEPLTLELPATGALHVHVSHPGREIESAAARVWVGALDDRDGWNFAWKKVADPDGVIRFGAVPVGVELSVELEIGDLGLPRTVAGPAAGQVAHVTFEVPADAVALTGRLLFPDGQPIASQNVWARCNLPTRRDFFYLETDRQGRFLWHPGAPDAREGEGPRQLTEFVVTEPRGPLDVLKASVARRELRAGINDLGDLVLDVPPLVVAGRFRSQPPRTDTVSVVVERWGDGAGSAASWQTAEGVFVMQHEGRFVARGRLPVGKLRLAGSDCVRSVEFTLGQQDVVLDVAPDHRHR